jgi:hypothetical protein
MVEECFTWVLLRCQRASVQTDRHGAPLNGEWCGERALCRRLDSYRETEAFKVAEMATG